MVGRYVPDVSVAVSGTVVAAESRRTSVAPVASVPVLCEPAAIRSATFAPFVPGASNTKLRSARNGCVRSLSVTVISATFAGTPATLITDDAAVTGSAGSAIGAALENEKVCAFAAFVRPAISIRAIKVLLVIKFSKATEQM